MSGLKENLKKKAKDLRIDLIGFASKERFADLDPAINPLTIFPEAESVIMIGRRITRGSLRGIEEGTNFGDYNTFGYRWLNDEFVAISCYDMVRHVEDQGYEAVPIFPNPIEAAGMGIPVEGGKNRPNIHPDFDYCAVACGLGEIALNGEVLNPEFGSLFRMQMIITDAPLESDPIFEGSLCDMCGACVAACPLDAIDINNLIEVNVCGKVMKKASIDNEKCKICKNGACVNYLFKNAQADRKAAICNRACVVELEKRNALSKKFDNKFRKRDPWKLDILGRITEDECK